MEIKKVIRMSAMVMGFGVALMMASVARGQEYYEPVWDDGTTGLRPMQTAPAPANSANTAVAGNPSAMTPTAVTKKQVTAQASVIPQEVPIERWTIAAL